MIYHKIVLKHYKPIHYLVANTFTKNDNKELNCVNHIDGDIINNHVSNLEWIKNSDNIKHRFEVLHTNENKVRGVTLLKSGKYEADLRIKNGNRYRQKFENKADAYKFFYEKYLLEYGFAPWDENMFHVFTNENDVISDPLIEDIRPELIKKYISQHGGR